METLLLKLTPVQLHEYERIKKQELDTKYDSLNTDDSMGFNQNTRIGLVHDSYTTAGMLDYMESKEKNPAVREAIATSTRTYPSTLEKLSNDQNIRVLEAVGENSKTPIEILEKLSHNPDLGVKMSVALNPNVSSELLNNLIEDKDEMLQNIIKTHRNYSPQNKISMEEPQKPDSVQQDAEITTDLTLPPQPDEGVNDQSPEKESEAIEGDEVSEDGKTAKKQGKGEMPSMRVNNQESAVENAWSNFMGAVKSVTRKIPEDKMAIVCATLEKLGCDLAKMKENGDLQRIQNGQKTEEVYEVNNPRIHKEGQSEKAKISFWLNENGEPIAYTHGVIQNPKFEEFKFKYSTPEGEKLEGVYKFTPEEQENLRTIGSIGKAVYIPSDDKPMLSIISRDRKTNRLYAMPVDKIKITDDILGVKLTDEQKELLKNGKVIEVEGMKSKFDEKEFAGKVCYNAERGGLEVNAKKPFIIGKILGVEPTQEEKDILRDGGVLKIERIKEDSTALNTHVRLNQEQTRLQFSISGKFDAPTHQMTESQMQQYDSGKVVKTNLIDKKGQPYVGFVKKGKDGRPLVSRDGTFQKKATEIGYNQQVDANNEGIAPDNETKKALLEGTVVKKGQSAQQLVAPYKHGKSSKYLPKLKM
jgi:hypothetical protein